MGKLLRVSGNRLVLQRISGKKVQTKALIPLVLFDLLAVGTAPYAYGGGGYGYGGLLTEADMVTALGLFPVLTAVMVLVPVMVFRLLDSFKL